MTSVFFINACDYEAIKPGERPDNGKIYAKKAEEVKADFNVHMAALPLISNTIKTMGPEFKNGFDITSIRDVCRLARGETTKENVRKFLNTRGINPDSIPESGNNLSILINNDDAGRKSLCAAYIASGVESPLDRDQFVEKRRVRNPKGKDYSYEEKVNPAKLSDLLAARLASARVNAEVYSLIASLLAQKKGLTSEEYYRETRDLFIKLSPYYLKRIQVLFTPDLSGYILTSADNKGDYSFVSTGGYTFTRTEASTLLTYRGVDWLGKGNILGYKYWIEVQDIPHDIINSLDFHPVSPSRPVVNTATE